MKQGEKKKLSGLLKPITSSMTRTVIARNNDEVTIISVLCDKVIAEYNNKRFTISTKYLK